METTVGQRLREFREFKQMKQNAFSEVAGIRQQTLSTLEADGSVPSYPIIEKLMTAFPDLSSDWLLMGKGEMLRDGRALTPASQLPPAVPSKLTPYREGLPTPGEATPQQADFVGRLIERLERELSEARVREAWYQEMLKKPLASHDAAGFMFAEPATPISMRPTACQPAECVVRPMWGPAEVDVQKAA